MASRALFLDRDGVICESIGDYLTRWEEFKLLPGIRELISAAKIKNHLVIAVTNQPQVAKKLLPEKDLIVIHKKMQDLLNNALDKIYYCPHIDADNCDCRKPKAGMLFQAQKELEIDLKSSTMVGDGDKDILAGERAGCRTIFIRNKFKKHLLNNCRPDLVVDNLIEAIAAL